MTYIVPIFYVILIYAFLILPHWFQNVAELRIVLMFLPLLTAIINFIIVLTVGRKWTKETLLNCTLIIKYGLIPFYLIGGCCTIGVTFLAVFPLPFMVLFGFVAILFLILGYEFLLGSAPYAIAYLIKAYKEGTHSKGVVVLSGICQFFFSFDVLSMMVLALKERHLVKTTIFVFCATCLSILAIIVWLAILFIK